MRRVVAFFLLGALLITLIGAMLQALGVRRVGVDIALIITLHVAMLDRRGGVYRAPVLFGARSGLLDLAGVATVLSLGYASDVIGVGLKGSHSFELGLAFVAARLMARQVYLAGTLSQIVVTFAASLLTAAVALLIRLLLGVSPSLATFGVVLGQAGLTGLSAPVVMRLCRFVDARLYREAAERGALRLR